MADTTRTSAHTRFPVEKVPTARKQVYFRVELRDAAMEEAKSLGQSWSVFVNRAVEHVLAVRHPDADWRRHPEFEDA